MSRASFDGPTAAQLSARLTGSAGLPNLLAIIAVFGLLCGLALAAEPDRRQRIAGGAIASLNACVILLSGSRAGLLLGLIAAVTLLVLLDQRPLVRFGPLLAALPGVARRRVRVHLARLRGAPARSCPHAGPQLLAARRRPRRRSARSSPSALGERLDRQPRRRRGITLQPARRAARLALLVALRASAR